MQFRKLQTSTANLSLIQKIKQLKDETHLNMQKIKKERMNTIRSISINKEQAAMAKIGTVTI